MIYSQMMVCLLTQNGGMAWGGHGPIISSSDQPVPRQDKTLPFIQRNIFLLFIICSQLGCLCLYFCKTRRFSAEFASLAIEGMIHAKDSAPKREARHHIPTLYENRGLLSSRFNNPVAQSPTFTRIRNRTSFKSSSSRIRVRHHN